MNRVTDRHMEDIERLCRKWGVRRIALFGSAARGRTEPGDVDFLVEFQPQKPVERAEAWFGLRRDLEELLERGVDLVEVGPIRNPYFLQSVRESQVVLFEAA